MRVSRMNARSRAKGSARIDRLVRAAVETMEPRRLLSTVTVTGTGDTIATDGFVTLREALASVNAGANVGDAVGVGAYGTNDTIQFNIAGAGVKTIGPTSALPNIVKPVTIDGYTQGVASPNTQANSDNAVILVQLDGTGAGAGVDGLVLADGSSGSTIKGLVINRFTGDGIVVESDGNTIAGNFIGTDPAGTTRMPNGTFPTSGDGIRIENASNNTIGGTTPAARNISSGNAVDGIHVVGTLTVPASGNLIQGNFVGVGADGVSPVGNRTEPAPAPGAAEGNNLFGIEISGGNNNTVGGTVPGARNVVGYNGAGIEVDNGGQQNKIQGNYSGIGADGVTPAGNLLHGIVLRSSNGFGVPLGPAQPNEPGVSFNLIGGTAAGAGNLVAFNGTGGIAIFGNPVSASGQPNVGNSILGNAIYQNGRSGAGLLGIDLTNGFTFPKDDLLTPNDSQGHGGVEDPNNFQNFPVLTSAAADAGNLTVKGSLKSAPNSSYRIEFFADGPDPLNRPAEGGAYLGFANITTDATGNATINATLSLTLPAGRVVTATATDGIGNTSEFSNGVPVVTQALSVSDVSLTEGNSGTKAFTFTVSLAAPAAQQVTTLYSTQNVTATNGSDYVGKSGSLTFNVGEVSKTVTVLVNGDAAVEGNEVFNLNLFNAVNASIAKQGKGTILNDDAGLPAINPAMTINDESIFEGQSGTRLIVFTVKLSAATSKTASVNYSTADGTAKTVDGDYTAKSGTVVFAPGQTTQSISITIKGDTKKELDETFKVLLSGQVNSTISDGVGMGTIRNDD